VESEEDRDTLGLGDRGKVQGEIEQMIYMDHVGSETLEAFAKHVVSPRILLGEEVEWRVERLVEHCTRETVIDSALNIAFAGGFGKE
jgi:hypothetical protein